MLSWSVGGSILDAVSEMVLSEFRIPGGSRLADPIGGQIYYVGLSKRKPQHPSLILVTDPVVCSKCHTTIPRFLSPELYDDMDLSTGECPFCFSVGTLRK